MERNNTHLSGENFVAAELYSRGFSVGMTFGNAKAIDPLQTRITRPCQYKLKLSGIKISVGWPMIKDKIFDEILYVFEKLNDKKNPDYYILTGQEARDKVKLYTTRALLT